MTKTENIHETDGGSVTKALPKGYTYFVRHQDMIKIGSSMQPEGRIRALQTGFPLDLEVLAVVSMEVADEYQTHQRFAHLRVRGEWFRSEPDLLAFIEAVKAEPLPPPPEPEIIVIKPKKARTEFDEIVSALIRSRPHLPPVLQRQVSNIAEMVQNLKSYVRPDWAADDRQTLPDLIRRKILAFETALRTASN
jgi:hypothetical protein